MTATLEQLVKVRSQLAEGVIRYLTQLGTNLDQTNWSCGGEWIKASDIAIEPFVLTMRWCGPRYGRALSVKDQKLSWKNIPRWTRLRQSVISAR